METISHNYIRQLRILAEAALTHYDIGEPRISLLSRRTHTLFRVTASPRFSWTTPPTQHEQDTRFVLRLCEDQPLSNEMLASELLWLSALREETALLVPEPVVTRMGTLVIGVQVADVPLTRSAMLFRWVDGRCLERDRLSPALFARVGTFMAQLHQAAHLFKPPSDFQRPHCNFDTVFGPETILDPAFVAREHFSAEDWQLLMRTARHVHEQLQHLSQSPLHYGMIHADLRPANLLFHRGEVTAIDFYHCCFGYYLFDIAVALQSLAGHAEETALHKAFFKAYTKILPLPAQTEKLLYAFQVLYFFQRLNGLFHSENPYARAQAVASLPQAFALFRNYQATLATKVPLV